MENLIQFDLASANTRRAMDYALATEISRILARHYPGYRWAVNADSFRGIVTIENWALSMNNGYTFRLADMTQNETMEREVKRAGGEFLERFNQSRVKANTGALAEAAGESWYR